MIRLFAVVLAGFASVSTAIAAEGIRPVFGMAVTGGGVRKAGSAKISSSGAASNLALAFRF